MGRQATRVAAAGARAAHRAVHQPAPAGRADRHLGRPKFTHKIAASRLTADQLVDGYARLAALVRPLPIERTAPDPDDDVVIATALAAHADLVVTGDKPLLSLAQHLGIAIVGVVQAIEAIAADRGT